MGVWIVSSALALCADYREVYQIMGDSGLSYQLLVPTTT